MTDADMADKLGIAIGTIATYWGRIRAKFGGSTRTELVANALRESYKETIDELRGQAHDLAVQLRKTTGEQPGERNLYQSIVEAAADAIVMVDAEGKIEYVNPSALELFGFARGEVEGSSINSLLPDRYKLIHSDHVKDYVSHPAKRQMGEHLSTPAKHKSGREFPIIASLSYIETADGILVSCFVRPLPALPYTPPPARS